jgi:hypothetical protein
MYAAPGIGLAATQVDFHQRLVVLPCGEVAVDFSEKRATTTREQLRRVHGVFDRVTQHHDTGPTRQRREDAQHVLIGTEKVRSGGVNDNDVNALKFARLGDTPVVHLPNVENAGNVRGAVCGTVQAQGVGPNDAHPYIVGVFANQIDAAPFLDLVACERDRSGRSARK